MKIARVHYKTTPKFSGVWADHPQIHRGGGVVKITLPFPSKFSEIGESTCGPGQAAAVERCTHAAQSAELSLNKHDDCMVEDRMAVKS